MKRKEIVNWLIVVFWLVLIFFLSSQPNLKTELGYDFWLRKVAHVAEYGILCFLFFRASIYQKISIKKALLISIIFSALYAASDEYHQTFVLGRSGNIRDWLIDVFGVLIGALAVYIYKKYAGNKKTAQQ